MKPDYLVSTKDFNDLFLQNTPFLDVRAEGEFAKGAIPHAINLPILNNHERHLVGTCYKQRGREAAMQLGHQLVSGELKAVRIRTWCERVLERPGTHVYCWRGGMRSKLARQWMCETGVDVPLIEGGYKALRRSLMAIVEKVARDVPMIRIGGKTGVAKTRLINEIDYGVDLERHANHRGSSFGRMVSQQPTQADFEHQLAIDLLHKTNSINNGRTLFVEDESRSIGLVGVPLAFYNTMRCSPLIIVEMPFEFRVQQVLKDYVVDMLAAYQEENKETGFENFSCYLSESLLRIQKRLGMERHKRAHNLLVQALQIQANTESVEAHEAWIALLLREYYDPMYSYQLQKNDVPIVFRGNYDEVLAWSR